jgi:hypothetical protein
VLKDFNNGRSSLRSTLFGSRMKKKRRLFKNKKKKKKTLKFLFTCNGVSMKIGFSKQKWLRTPSGVVRIFDHRGMQSQWPSLTEITYFENITVMDLFFISFNKFNFV